MRNDSFQLYTRQSDWIRAVRRTTGEYSDSFISSKSRRPHGRFPCTGFLSYFRKSPQKPQVCVFFNSSQSVRLAKLRLKYNKSSRIGKPTLSWNPEFSRKICVNSCDYFYLLPGTFPLSQTAANPSASSFFTSRLIICPASFLPSNSCSSI